MCVAAAAALALGVATAALAADPYGGYPEDTTTAPATTTESSSTTTAASETYHYTAPMTAKQEVPAPKGVPAKAKGGFTATVVEAGDKITLKWKLTFSGLTGKVGAAHIHKGKKGKPGGVILALCGPCRSGQTGTASIPESTNSAIEKGLAYVNVHTTKNAAGELRGQLALVKKT
jgi:hypothetical protein